MVGAAPDGWSCLLMLLTLAPAAEFLGRSATRSWLLDSYFLRFHVLKFHHPLCLSKRISALQAFLERHLARRRLLSHACGEKRTYVQIKNKRHKTFDMSRTWDKTETPNLNRWLDLKLRLPRYRTSALIAEYEDSPWANSWLIYEARIFIILITFFLRRSILQWNQL